MCMYADEDMQAGGSMYLYVCVAFLGVSIF